jgi:hypothetical protein
MQVRSPETGLRFRDHGRGHPRRVRFSFRCIPSQELVAQALVSVRLGAPPSSASLDP